MKIEARRLENRFVVLEPLEPAHEAGLRAAASSGLSWAHMPLDGSGEGFARLFERALSAQKRGDEIVYAVRRVSTGSLAGSTSFLNIVPEHKRAEIGFTWYARSAQGSEVNPGAKLLLFAHAFASGANRVELKCDARNARSRAAILKLGATQEGILRHHMVMPDGHLRDTVYFSVLAEEWPQVRARLEARLA
jgi:RimJ/RimL family protein N-acetyltransferase